MSRARIPAAWLSSAAVLGLAVTVVAALVPLAAADEPPSVAADPRVADALTAWAAWVDYQLGVEGVPGASLALVHDQEVLLARGVGLANPETGRAADADTIYSICSISKLFTSISVLRERDAGHLRLDEPISSYLDWFSIADAHPGDEAVTLRRILTHSSGLPRESDYPYWSAPDFRFPSHDEIVRRLAEQQTLYPSGRYFQYSNLGLTLAGEVVAATSGEPWADYVQTQILTPLGMMDTFTEIPEQHEGDRLALGYSAHRYRGERQVMPFFQARGIAPAAGMASTAGDLARFAAWQFRLLDEEPRSETAAEAEILRPATLREMQRVHWVDPDWETTWGLGFSVRRSDGRTLVGHGGACPGYFTQILLEPKTKMAAIVLSNAMGTEVGRLADGGLKLVTPQVEAVVGEAKAAAEKAEKMAEEATEENAGMAAAPEPRDPDLDRYTGLYTSPWGDAAIVRWKEGLAELWLDSRDPVEALSELRRVEDGDHLFRRVREDDGTLAEEVEFEVDPEGRATRYRQHGNWMVRRGDLP